MQPRWSRVERRASSLLMAAIPDQLREEVVASKSVSALGILSKGMPLSTWWTSRTISYPVFPGATNGGNYGILGNLNVEEVAEVEEEG